MDEGRAAAEEGWTVDTAGAEAEEDDLGCPDLEAEEVRECIVDAGYPWSLCWRPCSPTSNIIQYDGAAAADSTRWWTAKMSQASVRSQHLFLYYPTPCNPRAGVEVLSRQENQRPL